MATGHTSISKQHRQDPAFEELTSIEACQIRSDAIFAKFTPEL